MFECTLMICLAIIAFSPMLPAQPPTQKGGCRRTRHRGHQRLPACPPGYREGPAPTLQRTKMRILSRHTRSSEVRLR